MTNNSDNIKFPKKQRTSITISEVPDMRQAHKHFFYLFLLSFPFNPNTGKANYWYKNVIDSLQQTNLIILIDYGKLLSNKSDSDNEWSTWY